MQYVEENNSPGKKLQNLLKDLYPLSNESSFVSRIDDALIAEGEFISIAYESTINYMVRRLINTAEYIYRKNKKDDRRFVIELRSFIRDYTHIPKSKIEKIVELLRQCSETINKKITDGQINEVMRATRNEGLSCYICGCALDYADKENLEHAEAEHHWPHQMGGVNDSTNLRVSCRRCNRSKKNYIDASDFHFEHISLKTDQKDNTFTNEFNREYRIAAWAKNGFRCMNCGEPSSRVGELTFARREPNDSWHFLNIECYCKSCMRLLKKK